MGVTSSSSSSQTLPLIEEEPPFQNTWKSWKEWKYEHGSSQDPKQRLTVLRRASSNLLNQLTDLYAEILFRSLKIIPKTLLCVNYYYCCCCYYHLLHMSFCVLWIILWITFSICFHHHFTVMTVMWGGSACSMCWLVKSYRQFHMFDRSS